MTEPIGEAAWQAEPEPTPEPVDEVGNALQSSPADEVHNALQTSPDDDADDEGLDPRARAALRKARNEAKNLRDRLRDTEERLGAAAARLDAHHRSVVAQTAAAAGLIDGNDLLAVHPDTSEFLDEQFQDVVEGKVRDSVAKLLEAKPYLGRSTAPPGKQPLEGLRAGATPEQKKPAPPSWATALRGTGI